MIDTSYNPSLYQFNSVFPKKNIERESDTCMLTDHMSNIDKLSLHITSKRLVGCLTDCLFVRLIVYLTD